MKTPDSPNPDMDPLQSWLEAKRALRPAERLADSVMAALKDRTSATDSDRRAENPGLSWWQILSGSVWARAAVILLATIGGLGRVVLVLVWLLRS